MAIAVAALAVACSRAPVAPGPAITRSAEANGATMTVTVDRDSVEAGQTLTLTIETTGDNAVPPALPATLGPFDVRPIPQPARADGPRRVAFALSTLDTGTLEIPAIDVPLGAGDDAAKLHVDAIPVTVTSLLQGDDDPKKFRDIKGVVDIDLPRDWRRTATIAGIGVAIVAGLVALWYFVRRGAKAARLIPAHERAMSELSELERRNLPATGQVHEYFVVLSDIVRGYVARRYGIRAPELTTPEFLREARRSSAVADVHQTLLAGFLRGADMVKFGGERPSAAHCADSIAQARSFVRESAATAESPLPLADAPHAKPPHLNQEAPA